MSRPRLKIWPDDLEQIRMGRKRAEVRRCDDRKFRVGQEYELEGFDVSTGLARGGLEVIRITHVETMAGPLNILGGNAPGDDERLFPLAVLSFELLP